MITKENEAELRMLQLTLTNVQKSILEKKEQIQELRKLEQRIITSDMILHDFCCHNACNSQNLIRQCRTVMQKNSPKFLYDIFVNNMLNAEELKQSLTETKQKISTIEDVFLFCAGYNVSKIVIQSLESQKQEVQSKIQMLENEV